MKTALRGDFRMPSGHQNRPKHADPGMGPSLHPILMGGSGAVLVHPPSFLIQGFRQERTLMVTVVKPLPQEGRNGGLAQGDAAS